ncbi:MAG: DJ-1/PfpI family protein, partial [Pseudomonadota bacterium]
MTEVKKDWNCEIGLLIYPDCQLSAIYGLTDLFRIAGEWADGGNPRQVRVTHWRAEEDGVPMCVWDTHSNKTHHLDYVITPPSIVMPDKMQPMPQEAEWLRSQHKEGSRVCSICAGAFVLAESGLLQGRRVTTHWAFAKHLAQRYEDIEVADRNLVLDDGDVISAGGILAWTDLGLTLVERLFGRSTMLSTARFLVIQPPRATQLPFTEFVPDFDHGDEAILR